MSAWWGEKNDTIFSQPESGNRVAEVPISRNDEKCGRGWVIEGVDDEVHCNGMVQFRMLSGKKEVAYPSSS